MNEDILHQPHDKFFKAAFSVPIVVQESLNAFLPAPLLARVDLSGITPDTTSYVSENLKAYFSDIVWNVPINGKNMKVAFLFEHKTELSNSIFVQLLRYYAEIWSNNIKNNEKYIPIIPYIVFQSGKDWKYRTFESCFEHFDPLFLPYTPLFEYLLIATNQENEAALRNMEAYHSYMVFKAMRQVATAQLDKADLVLLLQEFDLMPYSEFGEILSQVIFYYTFAHSEATPDEVLQKISELSQSKSNYMSTLQQMFIKSNADGEAKGEARGKAEGEARGKQLAAKILKLYLKGAKAAAIAAQLELALEFVEQTIADYEAA